MDALSTLDDIDRKFATHPNFGDDDLIIARAHGRLRLILDFVISRSELLREQAGRLGEEVLDASLGHPVVRQHLENEARRWHYDGPEAAELTPPDVETVLSRALDAFAKEPPPVGSVPYLLHGPRSAEDPLAADLEAACEHYLETTTDTTGRFLAIDDLLAGRIRDAMRLADELLPATAAGTFRHIRGIAVLDAVTAEGRLLSAAMGDSFPGVILLDIRELDNVWAAAVRLLHEALHLKLFEISRATSIVADPIGLSAIPWRQVQWELRRVFGAFHVYAHVIACHRAIELRSAGLAGRYGEPPANAGVSRGDTNTDAAEKLATPSGRATWLGRQLHGPLRSSLTPYGIQMLSWLIETIRPLFDVLGEIDEVQHEASEPRNDAQPNGAQSNGGRLSRGDLVYREITPARTLAVLNRTDRSVHMLNLHSWLVLELCDGRGWPEVVAAHRAAVSGKVRPGSESALLESAVRELRSVGLVAATP